MLFLFLIFLIFFYFLSYKTEIFCCCVFWLMCMFTLRSWHRSQSLMIFALYSPILSSSHYHLVINAFFFSMNILPTTISCGSLSMVSLEHLENCLSFESERKWRVAQRQYLSYRNFPSMCISILMVKILSPLYNSQ